MMFELPLLILGAPIVFNDVFELGFIYNGFFISLKLYLIPDKLEVLSDFDSNKVYVLSNLSSSYFEIEDA